MMTWYFRLRKLGAQISHYLIVLLFTIFAAFPFYWMFITTFKQTPDLLNLKNNPYIFNKLPTLEHLELLFFKTLYVKWVLNTFFVGVIVVGITLVISVPAGYSLARLAGRWGERLGIGIFLTYLVPPTLLFIPLSRVVAEMGLQDSLWSLVVVYPSFTIPFCTWLLMGFFKSIPQDVEEAAMIDGCSRLGAITKVVIPISVAGILTVIAFAFTLVIQEFVYALTFITSSGNMTVSVGVPTNLVRGDVYYWGPLMAAALITSIPIAIVYNLFLDRFIAGFTVGAIR
ncbi:MAG: carbohydrate ABC transporter permease [Nitrospinota bacterium]|nr:MAG: carbohydrate ABC transporter permease [Nitrospinota bacterium]